MMVISTKTVVECTCDICGNSCDQSESNIGIKLDNGDGRDIGPSYIHAVLKVEKPYQVSGGIVCIKCKIEWLSIYIDRLKRRMNDA